MDGTFEWGALITLVITNIVSPFITWAQAKKRYYSEVDSNNIKNMQDSLEFWKNVCDGMRQELDVMRGENQAYREAKEHETDQLRAEIRDLRSEQMAMYQLMCMDLPCKSRQSYLSQGEEEEEQPFRHGELKRKLDELRMCNRKEVQPKKTQRKTKENKSVEEVK